MQFMLSVLGNLDGMGVSATFVLIALLSLVSLSVARSTFFSRHLPQGAHPTLRTALAAVAGGMFLAATTVFSGVLGIQLEYTLCLIRDGLECGAIGWALLGYFFAAPGLALVCIVTVAIVAATRWQHTPAMPRPLIERVALWVSFVLSCVLLAGIYTLHLYAQDHAKQRAKIQWSKEQQYRADMTATLMQRAGTPARFACKSGDTITTLEVTDSVVVVTDAVGSAMLADPDGHRVPYTSLVGAKLGTIEGGRLVPTIKGNDVSSWFWERFGRCVNVNGLWLESVFLR